MKSFFLLLALLTTPAFAADHYYVVMFGYDGQPATLKHAHTFVDFVQTAETGELRDQVVLSWLPARDGGKEIQPLGKPEPGFNADLAATLALAQGRTLVYWEPLEIDVDLFQLAKARVDELKNHPVQFVLFDRDTSAGFAAVSDLTFANVMEPRGFGFLSGPRASKVLLEHFGPYLFDEHTTHPEVLTRIRVGDRSLAETLVAVKAQVQDVWNLEIRRH